MARFGLAQEGLLGLAARLGVRAAGVEAAARGRMNGLGTSPVSTMRSISAVGSGRGIADSSAWV